MVEDSTGNNLPVGTVFDSILRHQGEQSDSSEDSAHHLTPALHEGVLSCCPLQCLGGTGGEPSPSVAPLLCQRVPAACGLGLWIVLGNAGQYYRLTVWKLGDQRQVPAHGFDGLSQRRQ